MPDESADQVVAQLVKLDGKIDLLGVKLDAHRDLLLAEIKAGDREAGQAIALTNERVSTLGAAVADNRKRLEALELVANPIPTVTKIVYGFVGLTLVAVITGLLALVIRSGP